MYSENYKEDFTKINPEHATTIDVLVRLEKNWDKMVLNWSGYDISQFLKSFHAKSPISLSKYMNGFKKFTQYVAEKNGVQKRDMGINNEDYFNCIDLDKLIAQTISKDEYEYIRLNLKLEKNKNTRDKLLFEMAWEGLTCDEIKNLKESDVEIHDNGAFVRTDNNIYLIEDEEVVNDIQLVLKENTYFVHAYTGVEKCMSYTNSEYLFKPVAVGRKAEKPIGYLSNPTASLQTSLFRNNIKCEGISMKHLGLEDIRRSRLIYMLHQNSGTNFHEILSMFDIKSETNLYWLRKIIKSKYENH